MKNGLVTIVIPVYNGEQYIERCVSSVVKQTYKNLEIIIVNDGSTDKSREIVAKFAENDKRIAIIDKKNGGLSSARNAALKIFKGDYIYFLDADDYLYVTSIEYLTSIMENNDVDIVYSFTNRLNANSMILDSEIEIKNKDEAIESYLKGENFAESCCAKLYKRFIFEKLKFAEGKIHEDTFITYRILDLISKIAITKFNGYISDLRPDSITHSKFGNKNYDKVEASRNIFEFYKNTKYRDLAYNKYIGSLFYFILKTNKIENVTKNKIAREELNNILKEEGIKSLKRNLLILSILNKLKLIKYLSYK